MPWEISHITINVNIDRLLEEWRVFFLNVALHA